MKKEVWAYNRKCHCSRTSFVRLAAVIKKLPTKGDGTLISNLLLWDSDLDEIYCQKVTHNFSTVISFGI